ncbi:MAG: TonB-dependent receptor, partial [Rhizomicrobium sp.]
YYYTRETNNRTNTSTGAQDGFAFDNGSSGNPNLDPYRANQIDVTYEYYFGKQGLFSVGVFWKGVESFTESVNVSTTVDDDFGGTTGVVSTYENGGGGRIQGVELSAQYAFESGFGVNVNYTYAESKTQNSDAFHKHLPFPGVSNNAFTVQTYYEQGPFEGHLSYTWKGSSFSSTYSITTGSDSTSVWGIYNRHYGQVDAQLTYKFLENLALVFEGRNLGGDAPSQYLQYKQQPFTYNQTGRRFSLDLKFNY